MAFDCVIEQKLDKCSIDGTEHGDGEMFAAWDPMSTANQDATGPQNASAGGGDDEVRESLWGRSASPTYTHDSTWTSTEFSFFPRLLVSDIMIL